VNSATSTVLDFIELALYSKGFYTFPRTSGGINLATNAEKRVFLRDATGLVREISTADALAINIIIANLVIGSVGLLVLPYTFPGVNLVGAVIVAAVASFSLAIVYWLFSVSMPRSGGDYIWNTRVLTPSLGFAANFSLTIWTIFYIAAYAGFVSNIGLSGFLTTVGTVYGNGGLSNLGGFFGTANGTFIVATIVNITMAALVARGLRVTLSVQRILAIIAFIGTVAAIILVAVSTNAQFISAFSKYGDYNAVISQGNSSGCFQPSPIGINSSPPCLGPVSLPRL